jgi:hypothetical protein
VFHRPTKKGGYQKSSINGSGGLRRPRLYVGLDIGSVSAFATLGDTSIVNNSNAPGIPILASLNGLFGVEEVQNKHFDPLEIKGTRYLKDSRYPKFITNRRVVLIPVFMRAMANVKVNPLFTKESFSYSKLDFLRLLFYLCIYS